MKTAIRFFTAVFLLFIASLVACHDDDLKPIIDYRCQVTMSSPETGKVYANTPIPISLQVKKNDSEIGEYAFSYEVVEGNGDVLVDGERLIPEKDLPVDIDKLSLSYVPKTLGIHKLKFKFQNEEYLTEAVYVLDANDLVFEAKAENLPEKLLIDKLASFDLNILQKAGEATEFDAKIAVLKGRGYISFVGEKDSVIYTRNLDPDDKIETRAAEDNSFRIKLGKNKLQYRSTEQGENILLLQIENEYGYSQDLSVPLQVELPDFSVNINCDTVAAVGVTNNFLLNISDKDNFGENIYSITYRNIKNSGSMKINNNEIQVGSVLQLQKGENICEFIPNELGPVALEFIVKDKYNTTKKDTAEFTAERSFVNITMSNYDTTATIFDTRNISFSVGKKNYKGKYYFSLVQNPLDGATIKINGSDYVGGKTEITSPTNTLISFVPKKVGKVNFCLKVYDDYDSETIQNLHFNISNSLLKVNVSNLKASLELLSETNFNFAIDKPNYGGKFKAEIIQTGEIPMKTPGKILIGGKEYSGGQFDITNPYNTSVTFIPETTGEITLLLKVYDDFGGEVSEPLIFSVSNTDSKISVNGYTKNIVLGQETDFNFSITKPFFDEKTFTYTITTEPAFAGTLNIDGQSYGNGIAVVKNNTPVKVGFVPAREGDVTLFIKAFDDFGGEISYPLTYSVSNPSIRIESMNYVSTAVINTESIFNIAVSKEHYKGTFKANLEIQPAGAGKISIAGTNYEGGLFTLNTPEDTKIVFTPTTDGNITVRLTVSDEIKGKVTKEYTFKVANPRLGLSFSNLEDDLTVNKKTAFSFTASKANYTGKFFAEVLAENATDIKIGNADYINGQRVEIKNPLGTYISFIPTKVGRDTVKISVSVFDEWGGSDKQLLAFSVNNSNLDLDVSNTEASLFVGRATAFNFTGSKANYNGKLKYEIVTTPSEMGTFEVNGTDYISGKMDFDSDETIPVLFTPAKEGNINTKIIITDAFGAEKSRSFNAVITSPDIKMEVTDFISALSLNTENVFNIAVSKQYYKGAFSYSMTTTPLNAATIKVNDTEYKGGKMSLTNPENTKVTFIPVIDGDIILTINITDEAGGKLTRPLNYRVVNNPVNITVNNNKTGLIVNEETDFNFAVSKKDYNGKFQFEIITDPVGAGKFKINEAEYKGGRMDIANVNNTAVKFLPVTPGDVKMKIKVYDSQGGTQEKELPFTVKNSEFNIIPSNQETDIYYNVATTFNFGVLKPNYNGTYQIEILQTPENSGSIILNGTAYAGGKIPLTNPALSTIVFTSKKEGQNALTIKVYDQFGGIAEKQVIFNTLNPEIKLKVTDHNPDIELGTTTAFNFTVSKENYTGKFKAQIEQIPAGKGKLKLNNADYNGTETALQNLSNNVTFTPDETGAVSLNLSISDENGKTAQVMIPFSVANTDISVNVTGKEYGLILSKATQVNFTVNKPNYGGKFKARVVMEPENAGSIKLNSSVFSGTTPVEIPSGNTLEFVPSKTGGVVLTIFVSDEHAGEKEVPLTYNVVNPPIEIGVTNKENNLSYNTATSANISIAKEFYTSGFDYEIIQEPSGSGTLNVNGSPYNGGINAVPDPRNLQISYTPAREGYVTLHVKAYDKIGGKAEKILSYTVSNPDIEMVLNTGSTDLAVGNQGTFTLKAAKAGYTGAYNYEITPVPADCGTITVNSRTSLAGTLSPNPAAVVFTPTKTGTAVLNIKVSDTQGKVTEKQVVYSVANTPISITFPNHTPGCILKNPTSFTFKATKSGYADSKKVTYSITPTTSGTITVGGSTYDGTGKEVTYAAIKNGLPVTFTPVREGECSLTFTVTDEFGMTESKTLKFTVTNPELNMFLSGVNTAGSNNISLGSTYKFTYNVSKANYNDDFAYWITLEPAAAGIIGTSDVTPRTARTASSGGGIQTETGTIKNNPNGMATGEVRVTVSNPDYLNKDVKVKVTIRDKWNNEKSQEITFHVITSAISVNVNRKNSIEVETPYTFYFTVSKPGYTGGFKYQVIGWNEGDKLETSADNNTWTTYGGGRFDLPSKDHTYIRYTPKKVGTVPMKLFIYDDANSEVMQELVFDVKAPEVSITSDAASKNGYINDYIPFKLTASDAKKETLNCAIEVENSGFSGELKFNNVVITPASRARSTGSNVTVNSGAENKLEMQSRKEGSWTARTTATNRFGSNASVSTTINVTEITTYALTTAALGSGKITGNTDKTYQAGTVVSLTATPSAGWRFIRWGGDLSGTGTTRTITMNSDKTVTAVFEEIRYTLSTSVTGEGSITVSPNQSYYTAGQQVTVTAVPADKYEFINWEGDLSGTEITRTITMDGDKNITAVFDNPTQTNIKSTMTIKAMDNSTVIAYDDYLAFYPSTKTLKFNHTITPAAWEKFLRAINGGKRDLSIKIKGDGYTYYQGDNKITMTPPDFCSEDEIGYGVQSDGTKYITISFGGGQPAKRDELVLKLAESLNNYKEITFQLQNCIQHYSINNGAWTPVEITIKKAKN